MPMSYLYPLPSSCLVAQLCLTVFDPLDCSLPGSSVPGILKARTLEWAFISFSRGSSQPRDRTCVSCIGRQILYHSATSETPKIGFDNFVFKFLGGRGSFVSFFFLVWLRHARHVGSSFPDGTGSSTPALGVWSLNL